MSVSVVLGVVTIALVLAGVVLYVLELEGWAQLLWVFASGTAGGAVVIFMDERT